MLFVLICCLKLAKITGSTVGIMHIDLVTTQMTGCSKIGPCMSLSAPMAWTGMTSPSRLDMGYASKSLGWFATTEVDGIGLVVDGRFEIGIVAHKRFVCLLKYIDHGRWPVAAHPNHCTNFSRRCMYQSRSISCVAVCSNEKQHWRPTHRRRENVCQSLENTASRCRCEVPVEP